MSALPRKWTFCSSPAMQLTEPQAGSDVGALRSKAERANDGSYRITGSKIFITYGEHDLTDNIIHFVLARLPDAPPGTKGISLFLVPKVMPDGTRNDVRAHSVEHKLGIHELVFDRVIVFEAQAAAVTRYATPVL